MQIIDMDFAVDEGWYGVDADGSTRWAVELADDITENAAHRESLRNELSAVQERLSGLADPALQAAVYVPDASAPSVLCALLFRVTSLDYGNDPQRYREELDADEGRQAPGERYDIVSTFTAEVDAGIAVGAYNVLTFSDLGAPVGHTEARAVIGVFPPQADQIVEFVFTTQDAGSFGGLVDLSMRSVRSLTIELGE